VTRLESEILMELRRLDETVAAMAGTGPKVSLLPIVQELSRLTAALPPGSDSQLLHYLHKRSFEKARLFLEGREGENIAGPCGHVGTDGR
jgi:hypothetical protein